MTLQNDNFGKSTYQPTDAMTTPAQPSQDVQNLYARLAVVESKIFGKINLNTDIFGLFETVSAAPTLTPSSPYDQVKIYVNGSTYRLYWYDGNANVWHYVTATA